MALLLRGLLGLSVLGGAAVGIGLPTNNAVQSILNKQQIRDKGGNGAAGRSYEEYGYGKGGFGDSRTRKVSAGGGQSEIETALTDVRKQGGKEKIGVGLGKNFEKGIKDKKLCSSATQQVGTGANDECSVGNIEFIDKKDESLFGRIPVQGKDGKKSNVYVKWYKCTNTQQNTKKISGIGFGGYRKEDENKNSKGDTGKTVQKYSWCIQVNQSK